VGPGGVLNSVKRRISDHAWASQKISIDPNAVAVMARALSPVS
jgi:hypothetical protein